MPVLFWGRMRGAIRLFLDISFADMLGSEPFVLQVQLSKVMSEVVRRWRLKEKEMLTELKFSIW